MSTAYDEHIFTACVRSTTGGSVFTLSTMMEEEGGTYLPADWGGIYLPASQGR